MLHMLSVLHMLSLLIRSDKPRHFLKSNTTNVFVEKKEKHLSDSEELLRRSIY